MEQNLKPLNCSRRIVEDLIQGVSKKLSVIKFSDLIPNCLLLHIEAGRNFETFIASTCGLEPSSSTDKFSNRRSCCQLGRNTCDIRGKSAYAQFDKTQFFLRHPEYQKMWWCVPCQHWGPIRQGRWRRKKLRRSFCTLHISYSALCTTN